MTMCVCVCVVFSYFGVFTEKWCDGQYTPLLLCDGPLYMYSVLVLLLCMYLMFEYSAVNSFQCWLF